MPLSLVDHLKFLGLLKYDDDGEFAKLTEARVAAAREEMLQKNENKREIDNLLADGEDVLINNKYYDGQANYIEVS